ncbi:50S ribosomal protein L20 [Candidatus Parcubacteria bacterium]|nr:50S ribosomal protein L20 [Candidatus Parcubacteria bacterium]
MVRVKRGKIAHKRRKRVLKKVKGYRWKRKTKYRLAKDALTHALVHAYRHRREKKRTMRRLWQTQISAALKPFGISYSKFIHQLKQKKIEINRKLLAGLAQKEPEVFKEIVKISLTQDFS